MYGSAYFSQLVRLRMDAAAFREAATASHVKRTIRRRVDTEGRQNPRHRRRSSPLDLLRVDRLDSKFHSQIHAEMERQRFNESRHIDANKKDAFPDTENASASKWKLQRDIDFVPLERKRISP